LILFVLTLLGLSGTTNSSVDLQIASNDSDYVQVFYAGESGWQLAVSWLDTRYPLPTLDMGLDMSSGSVSFSSSKYTLPDSNSLDSDNRYSVAAQYIGTTKAPGYSTDFRRFRYSIASTGTGSQDAESEIVVTAHKIGKVGTYYLDFAPCRA